MIFWSLLSNKRNLVMTFVTYFPVALLLFLSGLMSMIEVEEN